ncbi:MAG: S8 family serine peptidase [Phycisphaerales bacterium]
MRFPTLPLAAAALFLLAGMPIGTALAQGDKIVVKTADDLPRHTYKFEGKASEMVVSDAPFKALMAQIVADCESDLAKYDIQDPTTLQEYHRLLQAAAMLKGDLDAALKHADRVKELEAKESKKLMSGAVLRAYAAATKSGKTGDEKTAFFGEALKRKVSSLPWDKVGAEITSMRGQAQFVTRELIMGQIESSLDPIVAGQEGQVPQEIARGILQTRFTLDIVLPLMPKIAEVYGAVIESKAAPKKDIWPDREAVLDASRGSPVVACIWDSGTDVQIFKDRVWVNAKETVNGKDDDGNGFVDDVNGIAWDLETKPVPELLHPLTDMKNPVEVVRGYTKGLGDSQSGVESPEADALRAHVRSLKSADEVKTFMEDLGLYGNYSHGTHVAGIAAKGNPHIRLLPIRITFDYRQIPLHTPSVEKAREEAKAAQSCVNYMKAAGVRVVNMSWGESRANIEAELAAKNVGKDPAERAAMAREIFGIQKNALEQAMKSAPEILFVAAAGNSDDNVDFAELIPSGIKLPNLVTVGAVDQSGAPTSFTSFGEGVEFYASGFEVESYVPGGVMMRYNGTSMAAPQVANLAAKLWSISPKLTVAQVLEAIRAGGDAMDGHANRLLINPRKSVEAVSAK